MESGSVLEKGEVIGSATDRALSCSTRFNLTVNKVVELFFNFEVRDKAKTGSHWNPFGDLKSPESKESTFYPPLSWRTSRPHNLLRTFTDRVSFGSYFQSTPTMTSTDRTEGTTFLFNDLHFSVNFRFP